MRILMLAFSLILTCTVYSDASVAYIVGQSSNIVYRMDLTNGTFTQVTTVAGNPGLVGITLANPTTAYASGINDNNIYRINLSDGSYSKVTPSPITGSPGLDRISLASDTIAYVGGFNNNNLYRVDLTNGSYSLVTPSAVPGTDLAGIQHNLTLTNPTTVYGVTGITSNVYGIDLTNGTVTQITPSGSILASSGLRGLGLANNTTAYVGGFADGNVYKVNLVDGSVSLITPSPVHSGITQAQLQDVAMTNSTSAYLSGNNTGFIYLLNLTNGSFYQINSTSIAGNVIVDIALVLQIGTSNLSGNNLSFANYLNNNAFLAGVPLFALQDNIAGTLESASPTRNAIFTFASQTTQLAMGQVVSDHLGQRRWRNQWQKSEAVLENPETAQLGFIPNRLFADASDSEPMITTEENETPPALPKKETHYSPWLGILGEYTREKAQMETPAFQTGTGGFVAAFDFYQDCHALPLIGGGIAYAYTHVHEDDGAGHANINQGALVCYAAWSVSDWYFDLGVWGGMYHARNIRAIVLPGIASANATASTNGWQLTPHFEVGYDYKDHWFTIEPFDMLDWVVNWEESFHEHGAGVLNIGQEGRTCALLRNEVGVRFNETLSYGWGNCYFPRKRKLRLPKNIQYGCHQCIPSRIARFLHCFHPI